jgi:hypothetical protein
MHDARNPTSAYLPPGYQERRERLLRALGTPEARAWLEQRLASEVDQAPFKLGDHPTDVAWRGGRVAMLRDILGELRAATPETR